MSVASLIQLVPLLVSGASAVSSISGGRQAKASGKDLAKQYKARGAAEARILRIEAVRRRGAIRAGAAGAGLDPNRGTPADVIAETAYFDELDAQMVEYNANLQAQRARLDGKAAATSGFLQAGATILSAATSNLKGLGPTPSAVSGGPGGFTTTFGSATPLPSSPVGPNAAGYRIPRP